MGQCQKTDRPSCIPEPWFAELLPEMKRVTQTFPNQHPSPKTFPWAIKASGSSSRGVCFHAPPLLILILWDSRSQCWSSDTDITHGKLQDCLGTQEGALVPPALGVPWG